MPKKKKKIINGLAVAGLVLSSILALGFLGFVLESAFGGSAVNVGAKSGTSASNQQTNAGRVKDSAGYTAAPKVSPTPTPPPEEGGLPRISGFNPEMQLERISVWWDGKENEGKASTDPSLRYTYTQMCVLLEEVENFTPSENKLKFINTFGGGRELEFTIFEGNIAEFAGYEGRYFKIPPISYLADALLPIQVGELNSEIQERMADAGMLGCFGDEYNKVYLDKEISKKAADAFFELDKEDAIKPVDLPKRTVALVFYYYGSKYYVDVYETGLVRYNTRSHDDWYTVPFDQLENFLEILK